MHPWASGTSSIPKLPIRNYGLGHGPGQARVLYGHRIEQVCSFYEFLVGIETPNFHNISVIFQAPHSLFSAISSLDPNIQWVCSGLPQFLFTEQNSTYTVLSICFASNYYFLSQMHCLNCPSNFCTSVDIAIFYLISMQLWLTHTALGWIVLERERKYQSSFMFLTYWLVTLLLAQKSSQKLLTALAWSSNTPIESVSHVSFLVLASVSAPRRWYINFQFDLLSLSPEQLFKRFLAVQTVVEIGTFKMARPER